MTNLRDIDDLSGFLAAWYAVDDLAISEKDIPSHAMVPKALRQAWLKLGRLSVGYENWVRTGAPSPLACQDGLAPPGKLLVADGIALVVTENQGNWAIGYEAGTDLPDPPVFSNFLEQEGTAQGFIPVGCTLSNLIITTALTETIMFSVTDSLGATPKAEQQKRAASCDHLIWTGHYYNAMGLGPDLEKPSHQIKINPAGDLLCLFFDDRFSGFLANRTESRKLIRQFL